MNAVNVAGFLAAKPELKEGGEWKVAKMSLAVKAPTKKDPKAVEWVNLEAWNKTADLCAEYLDKGSFIAVSGRLKTDKWDKDGETRYSTKVVVNEITFGPKSQAKSDEGW